MRSKRLLTGTAGSAASNSDSDWDPASGSSDESSESQVSQSSSLSMNASSPRDNVSIKITSIKKELSGVGTIRSIVAISSISAAFSFSVSGG